MQKDMRVRCFHALSTAANVKCSSGERGKRRTFDVSRSPSAFNSRKQNATSASGQYETLQQLEGETLNSPNRHFTTITARITNQQEAGSIIARFHIWSFTQAQTLLTYKVKDKKGTQSRFSGCRRSLQGRREI